VLWKGHVRCVACGYLEHSLIGVEVVPAERAQIVRGEGEVRGLVGSIGCYRFEAEWDADGRDELLRGRRCRWFHDYRRRVPPAGHLALEEGERGRRQSAVMGGAGAMFGMIVGWGVEDLWRLVGELADRLLGLS